jgi:hypothetical protein
MPLHEYTPGTRRPVGIEPANPIPVDSWSGPYYHIDGTTGGAINNALLTIPDTLRFLSMEVRILARTGPGGSTLAYKYWFRGSTATLEEFASGTSTSSGGDFPLGVSASGATFTNLFVLAGTTLNGNVSVGDASTDVLTVTSGTTFANRVDVSGVAKFNGNVTVGDASSDVLTVTSGTTFQNSVDFSGAVRAATFTGNLTGNANTATTATTSISTSNFGGASASSYARTDQATTFNSGVTFASTLDVTDTARFNGNVTIGNASSDVLTVTSGTTFQNSVDFSGAVRAATFTGNLSGNANTATTSISTSNFGGASASSYARTDQATTFNSGVTFAGTRVDIASSSVLDVASPAIFESVFTGGTLGGVTYQFANIPAGTSLGQGIPFTVLNNAAFNGNVIIGPSGGQIVGGVTQGVMYVRVGTTFERAVDFAGAVRASTFTGNLTGNVTGIASNASALGGTAASGWAQLAASNTFTGSLNTFNEDVTVGKTLTVNGNFYVQGTLTTVNRADLQIDDKIIVLGRTLGTNTTFQNGAGIYLGAEGSTADSWTWNSTRGWESSSLGVNIPSTRSYSIGGTSVLSSSTLGSGVTTSSLQSVGTISTGVWQGTAVGITYGGTGRNLGGGTNWGLIYKHSDNTLQITAAGAATDVLQGNASGAPTWVNRSSLTGLTADRIRLTAETGLNQNIPLVYATSVIGAFDRTEGLRHDTGLYYNPLFQTLFAEKIEGTIDGGTW